VEQLIGLIVLVVVVIGGFMVFNRLRASPTVDRAARVARMHLDDVKEPGLREPTPTTLEPGDAVSFSDGGNAVVETVLECREVVGPRTTSWRWSFLDDGKMLEAAPDGNVLYDRTEVAYQGGELFQRLVAEADQGGILKSFEKRVRDGTVASDPLRFEHDGVSFHMRSTGTFTASVRGKSPGEVWQDVSPEAGDNVFFEAEAQTGEQLLGVWTSHIVVLVGRSLGLTDIDAIYPGTGAPR
jgi:hypothetical protein